MKLYFRNKEGTLSSYTHNTATTHTEAIQDMMAHLHETREVFFKPVLCLIQGGKQ